MVGGGGGDSGGGRGGVWLSLRTPVVTITTYTSGHPYLTHALSLSSPPFPSCLGFPPSRGAD